MKSLAFSWHAVMGRCKAGDERLGSSIRSERYENDGCGVPNLNAEAQALLHFSSTSLAQSVASGQEGVQV